MVNQTFVWDAENRLVEVRPADGTQVYGDKKVKFWYDYLGRCVQKEVQTWTAGSPDDYVMTERRKFMYHGWLPILELDALNSNAVLRAYTWGLDLSGTLDGLAGVGGLLAVHQSQTGGGAAGGGSPHPPRVRRRRDSLWRTSLAEARATRRGGLDAGDYLYFHDTSGNVGQLVAWETGYGGAQADEWHVDRLIAHYECDPYGGATAQSGTYAAANPVRFSTKYWDDETGLGYWGYRY